VRYVIKAKGVPVEIVEVTALTKDYKKINPLGKVPALQTLCDR